MVISRFSMKNPARLVAVGGYNIKMTTYAWRKYWVNSLRHIGPKQRRRFFGRTTSSTQNHRIDSRIDYTSTLARSIQQTMRGFYNNKQNNHVAIAVTVAAILVFMTPSPPQRHYTMVQSFTVPTTTTITTSRTSKTTRVNAIQMESKWSMMPDEPAPEVRSK